MNQQFRIPRPLVKTPEPGYAPSIPMCPKCYTGRLLRFADRGRDVLCCSGCTYWCDAPRRRAARTLPGQLSFADVTHSADWLTDAPV